MLLIDLHISSSVALKALELLLCKKRITTNLLAVNYLLEIVTMKSLHYLWCHPEQMYNQI
jgi:hypothetical protein